MPRKSKSKTAAAAPVYANIQIALESNVESVYANYAEVSSSLHEFQISFALAPTRLTAVKVEEMKSGGLKVEALVQILLPPTVIPGLIRALTITKEQHETMVGRPIQEVGITNG
jgi:hypothetical protein